MRQKGKFDKQVLPFITIGYMERRDVLKSLGLIGGSTLFPAVLAEFLSSCAHKDMSSYTPVFFTEVEYKLVIELIDIIIPATGTAAASQVNTHVFLDQVFSQCLTKEQQEKIHTGLKDTGQSFEKVADKTLFIKELDESAYKNKEAAGWFRTLKKYTMIGFFTSQEGTTKASNYVKVPEAYKADISADDKTLNYGNTTLHF
jgi:hypothetical protein